MQDECEEKEEAGSRDQEDPTGWWKLPHLREMSFAVGAFSSGVRSAGGAAGDSQRRQFGKQISAGERHQQHHQQHQQQQQQNQLAQESSRDHLHHHHVAAATAADEVDADGVFIISAKELQGGQGEANER